MQEGAQGLLINDEQPEITFTLWILNLIMDHNGSASASVSVLWPKSEYIKKKKF